MSERTIAIVGPRSRVAEPGALTVNTTSHTPGDWQSDLSPFKLGPCRLWDGRIALRMENAWQYSKVYEDQLGENGRPLQEWYTWSTAGFANPKAERYPRGKGARPKGSWLDNTLVGYIDARTKIYLPLYRDAVKITPGWAKLKELYRVELEANGNTARLQLWDYDAYDHHGKGLTLKEVLGNPGQIMGHAFVLAMMLLYGENFTPEQLP